MRATFSLSDEQFAANDRAGVMVGLPVAVQLDAGPLVQGQDPSAGWFVKANYGPAVLRPFSLDRVTFCGRITQLELWRQQDDLWCQAMLDCGLPMRIDLLDLRQPPEKTSVPYDLRPGDWVLGVAALRGLLALDTGDLLWQPVQGAIVDIQRLVLDPVNPAFGSLRWLNGLPRQPFAPDQVFVTIEIAR